jgi:ferric-dicitrate binding protein FerR (iron transport regulator)
MVEVTGTCFTLMCTDTGTCVCVLEGDVRVVDPIAGSNMVHGGKRKTMFRTGEAPEFGNMHENERGELIRLSQLIEQNSSD